MRAKRVVMDMRGGYFLFYELSEPITKGTSDSLGEVNIPELLNNLYDRLNPFYKTDAEKHRRRGGCYYVAILLGHGRKYVFPAIKIHDKQYGFLYDEIVESQAIKINGQVPVNIPPDEVYLQYLAILNNLCFEGIDEIQRTDIMVYNLDGYGVLDYGFLTQ